MWQDDHTWGYNLPNPMIGNIMVHILEVARGNGATGNQTIIISQYLIWSINSKSNYSKLVAHSHEKFQNNSHRHHLWSIGWGLHGILPSTVPMIVFEKHEYSSNGTPRLNIMYMICINKGSDHDRHALWILHDRWDILHNIRVYLWQLISISSSLWSSRRLTPQIIWSFMWCLR